MDTRVTCHTCRGDGRSTNDHERACERCGGEGLRDAREAAAHCEVVSAENEVAAAAQFSDAWWKRAMARLHAAHDAWSAELERLAREEAA